MINDEIDGDLFHQDFTTASEWELFNARLEEIFHEWKLSFHTIKRRLNKNELSKCEWEIKNENILFADVELLLTRYTAKLPDDTYSNPLFVNENIPLATREMDHLNKIKRSESSSPSVDQSQSSLNIEHCQAFDDLLAIENDYCILDEKLTHKGVHPLVRWYGLRDFVVIGAINHTLTNESKIRILLSSIHIAIAECNCNVPIFVQMLDKKQNVFSGVCETQTTRLTFDIVNLYSTPAPCKYLSGILDLFKEKIGIRYVDPVMVSVRLTYKVNAFNSGIYNAVRKYPFENSDTSQNIAKKLSVTDILPFGIATDPVNEILMYFTWPQVAENIVVDSETYTDFDPLKAPIWSIRSHFEMNLICLTSECIGEYLQLYDSQKMLTDIVGDHYGYLGNLTNTSDENPLDLLTESKISTSFASVFSASTARKLSSITSKSKDKEKLCGPLMDYQLKEILYYLFPDAQSNSMNVYYNYSISRDLIANIDFMPAKTAPKDSLLHRLSVTLAYCNYSCGGARAIAQLWAEFTQEMRFRVERCIQIPGIAEGFPESQTCLLHQKLQMLNVCMERRRLREGGLPFSMTQKPSQSHSTGTGETIKDDDSDDEFFDCSGDEYDGSPNDKKAGNRPEGRLFKLGQLTLVDSDEPLYVPRTQDPVPKTEDQLEDDAEVMLKLGPGSELRTQMMSASLLSDMESFKAANPNGKLEDFIRWYSPRDWIENEYDDNMIRQQLESENEIPLQPSSILSIMKQNAAKKGKLSPRMLIPGNTWQILWQSAQPIAARKQKRLFDDTKEAEKVLHFLESRNIGQIIKLTIATLFHSGLLSIREHVELTGNIIIDHFQEEYLAICKMTRLRHLAEDNNIHSIPVQKWENLLMDITKMELLLGKYHSLCKKLFPDEKKLDDISNQKLMASLMKGFEIKLPSEDHARDYLSNQMLNLFAESEYLDLDSNHKQVSLPSPMEKQFTLRVSGKTTDSEMVGPPQFLRAILRYRDFRLCGAFSQNTSFC